MRVEKAQKGKSGGSSSCTWTGNRRERYEQHEIEATAHGMHLDYLRDGVLLYTGRSVCSGTACHRYCAAYWWYNLPEPSKAKRSDNEMKQC